jgi:two-component system, cell cycle sensor histidine kinase and response regulator CckA
MAALTVLVVEDNRSIRPLLRRLLEGEGYRTLEAAGPTEALELLEREGMSKLDLLVTDVRMPGTSGCELGKQIAERYEGVRMLFMSGQPDQDVERLIAESPYVMFLQKPFLAERFVATVRALLSA